MYIGPVGKRQGWSGGRGSEGALGPAGTGEVLQVGLGRAGLNDFGRRDVPSYQYLALGD